MGTKYFPATGLSTGFLTRLSHRPVNQNRLLFTSVLPELGRLLPASHMQVKVPKEKRAAWWPSTLCTIAAVHGSLTVGYAYGYTSPALEQLSELQDGYAFHLGSVWADLFATLVPMGAFLFCLLSGAMTDRIGRKKIMLLTGIPNAAGWILIAVSPYVKAGGPSVFKVLILTGRFLTGVACSGIYAAVPPYSAEVALPKQRGSLAMFHLLFIIIGVSMAYGVGAVSAVSYSQSAIIGTGFVFAYMILVTILPESPRWLVIKGLNARAFKVLTFLRQSTELATKETDEIKKIVEGTPHFTLKKQLCEMRKRHVYIPLGINLCLTSLHSLCGQYVLEFYSAIILEDAGVNNPEVTSTYSVGVAQIFGVILSTIIIDRVGRKPLLIVGGIGTGIGAALLGTHFYVTQPSFCQTEDLPMNTSIRDTELITNDTDQHTTNVCNPHLAPLAICSVVLFSLSYAVSYRCVVVTTRVELNPHSMRGLAMGIHDCVGWLLIVAAVGSYSSYEQAVGPYTVWWSIAALGFGGVLFSIAFVPETKGKSLEEIEVMFTSSSITPCCTAITKLFSRHDRSSDYSGTCTTV